MADKIEMSLDEIIKQNKSSKKSKFVGGKKTPGNGRNAQTKPGGGIKKGKAAGGISKPKFERPDVNKSWKQNVKPMPVLQSATLTVNNLADTVSDHDMRELFEEFGPLKNVAIHYDRTGRTLGVAYVDFERKMDAVKAMEQYNGIPLDGRPMVIQMVKAVTQKKPLAARIGERKFQNQNGNNGGGKFKRQGNYSGKKPMDNKGSSVQKKGHPNMKHRKPATKPKPTLEELDAEMEEYSKQFK